MQSVQVAPQQVLESATQVPLLEWYPELHPVSLHVPLAVSQAPDPLGKEVVQLSDPAGPQFRSVCAAQTDPLG